MKRHLICLIALIGLIALDTRADTKTFSANPGDTVVINVAPAPTSGGSGSGGSGSGGSGSGGSGSGGSGSGGSGSGGSGGSGGATNGWSGVCPGFASTRVLDLDWQTPVRLYTEIGGQSGFGPNDVLVVRFTTGNVSSTNSLPHIAGAEYQSSPSSRIATLSATPCDFGPQPAFGAFIHGNSVTAVFAIGTGSGFGYYPVLKTSTTYYLNIKNDQNSSCASNGACDMFVDLVKAGGL